MSTKRETKLEIIELYFKGGYQEPWGLSEVIREAWNTRVRVVNSGLAHFRACVQ